MTVEIDIGDLVACSEYETHQRRETLGLGIVILKEEVEAYRRRHNYFTYGAGVKYFYTVKWANHAEPGEGWEDSQLVRIG
jgi:hypothetical protein